MLGTSDEELLEDGKVMLFQRNGIYQARVYKGDRDYLYRSLKTKDLVEARKRAIRLLHETEYKQAEGIPLSQVTMAQLIDEYVALRQTQYDQSQIGNKKPTKNANKKNSTSIYMLRQIKRVVKFWLAYCGSTAVDKVDNAVLQGFITWRKEYYHKLPKDDLPKNAKLNPTDKTLQWELTLGKTMLKYAHERGYRGKNQLPTYSLKGVKKIVRPAFTLADYIVLILAMRDWIKEANTERALHPRLLLRDYVLILSNSGMRVGEANNLQWRDVIEFKDERDRKNYMFNVTGKTGKRMVVPRTNTTRYIDRLIRRYPKREPTDYVFRMRDGSRVITLIDQFQNVLKRAGILENRHGERYTLYSLRHWYAVRAISNKKRIPVFDLARNMGTSVAIIEQYYGKQATPAELATRLGG
jgi:integrase